MTMVTAGRALAAEIRFVEEGHRVFLDSDRHCFTVVSDSRPGVRYEIVVVRQGGWLRAVCDCPAGRHAKAGVQTACKHGAGVLRRGAREGWARWEDGRWVATGAAAA
ncbi:MAG: hypothetical protein JO337_04785 [Acidimicrobiales bacterium]|nr:hypothetical protein [Acidimicrobiales bacterium]